MLPAEATGPGAELPFPAERRPAAAEGPVASDAPLEIGALYRAHAQTVARWAARLYGPGGPRGGVTVEDLVQEVFLIAHRSLAGFRGEAKVTTWLFRITQNVVRHRRRRERLRALVYAPERVAEQAGTELSPAEALERRQAQRLVYEVLDEMNEKHRTAFALFELEGLSGEEIAALLGQKPATIWVWLHRARAQFLKGLEKREAEEARRPGNGALSTKEEKR